MERSTILTLNCPQSMSAELHAVADTTHAPTYTEPIQLSEVVKGIHMNDIQGYEEYGADECGMDDIETSLMTVLS